MNTHTVILLVIAAIFIATSSAFAVPAKPIDATDVTLLPASGTPASLRKMATTFSAAIAKVNKDANSKRNQLRQHLLDGFERAITQAQTAGDLDTILALKEAKEKFDTLDDSSVPLVKNAILFREKKTADIESTRITDALKTAKDFNNELEKAKKVETQKANFEAAKVFSDQQKKLLEWVKTIQAGVSEASPPMTKTVSIPSESKILPGLSVRYYDIPNSGYSNWICSEPETHKYFRSRVSTLKTTTEAFGGGLSTGHSDSNPLPKPEVRRLNSSGMVPFGFGICRFHGNYGKSAADHFSALMTGKLRVKEAGTYSFSAVADDYIVVFVDGTRILNAQWFDIATGSKYLDVGDHTILVAFHEDSGGQGFTLQWKQPGTSSFVPIPQSVLFHGPDD